MSESSATLARQHVEKSLVGMESIITWPGRREHHVRYLNGNVMRKKERRRFKLRQKEENTEKNLTVFCFRVVIHGTPTNQPRALF